MLQRVCRDNGIHMEFSNTPMYNSAYIEGIGNLYEFDCGEQSGWMYAVNGWYPNYGCSRYALKDGDTVTWVYTCDYGQGRGRRLPLVSRRTRREGRICGYHPGGERPCSLPWCWRELWCWITPSVWHLPVGGAASHLSMMGRQKTGKAAVAMCCL